MDLSIRVVLAMLARLVSIEILLVPLLFFTSMPSSKVSKRE
jgi:hypothetical protein